MTPNTIKYPSTEGVLRIFILLGVLIALQNFIEGRSLWVDEAMLALNITGRTFDGLLKPLDHLQVAPIGFLFIEKFFTKIFGPHDWALRIFPMLCFLVSIPLFHNLTWELTRNRKLSLLAAALFSLTFNLINYSSEVKQYSTDVLVAIVLTLNTLIFQENRSIKNSFILAITGMLGVWFSNIAIIILFTAGVYCLYSIYSVSRKISLDFLLPVTFWLVSFLIYYYYFIHDHPARELMVQYWDKMKAFPSGSPFKMEFFTFAFTKTRMIFASLLGLGSFWLFGLAISAYGFPLLVKPGRYFFLMVGPLAIHFLLSCFKIYPFDLRVVLYSAPFVILIYSSGIVALQNVFRGKYQYFSGYLLVFPVFLNLLVLYRNLPIKKEEIKLSMEYIDTNINTDECLYVYYNATFAFQFYKEDFQGISGIKNHVFGKEKRTESDDPSSEFTENDRTIWLLFSHVSREKNNHGFTREEAVVNALLGRGYQIDKRKEVTGSSAYRLVKNPEI